MEKVKFAVIGYGNIGRRHVNFLKDLDGSEVISVCDVKRKRADEGAKNIGANAVYNYDEILSNENIDVIDLCTPSGLHAEMSIQAMEAGKHVISEKPMALTLMEADRIIKTEKRTGRKYFLVKQNRYNPPVAILKELVENGDLGDIFLITSNVFWNRHRKYFEDEDWRGTLRFDGGALFTQVSHFIDIIIWIGGDVKRIEAYMSNVSHPYIETEDLGSIRLEFGNGRIGILNYTISNYGRNMEGSIAVLGTKGSVKVGGKYLNEVSEWNVEGVEKPELPPSAPPNIYKGGYQGSMSNHDKILQNVINSLGKGENIAVTSVSGRKTVEAMQAAHISALEKRPVDLPLTDKELDFDIRKSVPFPMRR
jgi:predicted dehydrogenase